MGAPLQNGNALFVRHKGMVVATPQRSVSEDRIVPENRAKRPKAALRRDVYKFMHY